MTDDDDDDDDDEDDDNERLCTILYTLDQQFWLRRISPAADTIFREFCLIFSHPEIAYTK